MSPANLGDRVAGQLGLLDHLESQLSHAHHFQGLIHLRARSWEKAEASARRCQGYVRNVRYVSGTLLNDRSGRQDVSGHHKYPWISRVALSSRRKLTSKTRQMSVPRAFTVGR